RNTHSPAARTNKIKSAKRHRYAAVKSKANDAARTSGKTGSTGREKALRNAHAAPNKPKKSSRQSIRKAAQPLPGEAEKTAGCRNRPDPAPRIPLFCFTSFTIYNST